MCQWSTWTCLSLVYAPQLSFSTLCFVTITGFDTIHTEQVLYTVHIIIYKDYLCTISNTYLFLYLTLQEAEVAQQSLSDLWGFLVSVFFRVKFRVQMFVLVLLQLTATVSQFQHLDNCHCPCGNCSVLGGPAPLGCSSGLSLSSDAPQICGIENMKTSFFRLWTDLVLIHCENMFHVLTTS